MKKHLLPQNGNFYKANLHCHSRVSDGACTPQELKELYKSRGYSVLAITDHDGMFYHPELNDSDFLTLAGYEVSFNDESAPDWFSCVTCHICVYKIDPSDIYTLGRDPSLSHPNMRWTVDPELKKLLDSRGSYLKTDHTIENINTAIKRFHDNGFLVTYNHPKWSMEDYTTYSKLCGMDNIEVYNNSCYTMGFNEYNGEIFDVLLRQGKRVNCVSTDDNHSDLSNPDHDMFGGFTMLKAPELSYSAIMHAFKNGDFYASSGPEISELYVENSKITVKTATPVKLIRMLTGKRNTACKMAHGDEKLYSAEFELDESFIFARLELVDFEGKTAFTNAYYMDNIL